MRATGELSPATVARNVDKVLDGRPLQIFRAFDAMSDQIDQRNQWQFVPVHGKWKWYMTTPDGAQSESAAEFSTLAECATDAARHGYIAWRTEDERRRELKLGVMDALKPKE